MQVAVSIQPNLLLNTTWSAASADISDECPALDAASTWEAKNLKRSYCHIIPGTVDTVLVYVVQQYTQDTCEQQYMPETEYGQIDVEQVDVHVENCYAQYRI